jgi:prepilin-type N-terminal cleavage/methylation domain-containing protein/prepilin-type processing-associated H-X9-DG protein
MRRHRPGLTLVEILVVIAIIGILISMLLPAVQQVRVAAARLQCANNLRQMGLALHNYHDTYAAFPPALVASGVNAMDAQTSGFTYLLPFLEQDDTYHTYNFDDPWYLPSNYQAVGTAVKVFYCPANRDAGGLSLGAIAVEWSTPLPPFAAGCDYAFCRGANGALPTDPSRIPPAVRGAFNLQPDERRGVPVAAITDGTSTTFAMGDAAGGSPLYLARDLNNSAQPAIDPLVGAPVPLEQSWGAASVGDTAHPWYGSVLAVTAQYGLGPEPRDEPMNRQPATPTVYSGASGGDNQTGKDYISGFRSLHPGGCNFLFCDGGVRFLNATVSPDVYRALSTIAGREVVSGSEY